MYYILCIYNVISYFPRHSTDIFPLELENTLRAANTMKNFDEPVAEIGEQKRQGCFYLTDRESAAATSEKCSESNESCIRTSVHDTRVKLQNGRRGGLARRNITLRSLARNPRERGCEKYSDAPSGSTPAKSRFVNAPQRILRDILFRGAIRRTRIIPNCSRVCRNKFSFTITRDFTFCRYR